MTEMPAFDLSEFQTSAPRASEDLRDRGWNLRRGDLDFPMLALQESALRANIATMAAYCERNHVGLCPHGKTTMMPWVFEAQLAAGAWGITAAIPAHVKTYRRFGVSRILLANVLVDPPAIRWVAEELEADPEFEFLCYVDSAAGVDLLERTLAAAGAHRPVEVLVELGYPGGRTGLRSVPEALAVADRVQKSGHLTLRGVSAFEGFFPVTKVAGAAFGEDIVEDQHRPDPVGAQAAGAEADCRAFLRSLHALVSRLEETRDPGEPLLVTAGGSAYFDLVLDELGPDRFDFPVEVVLRSGCYVSHDSGMYADSSPFDGRAPAGNHDTLTPALELWATVWSRPEPELIIVGFGRRDAPSDERMPIAQRICDADTRDFRELSGEFEVTALNDQHAYVRVPAADPVKVGDQIVFGVSHPCGAFDRWPWIAVIDDDYNLTRGARTYF